MAASDDIDRQLTNVSASDNAAAYIRGMIYSGKLTSGQRLPSGVDLAAILGISVVTLRVALKSLETSGYIVTSRGAHGGSRVSDAAGLTECWTDWMAENADDLDDLFELRSTIEMRIAWLAAERRSVEDLQQIEEANELLSGPDPSVAPWNVAFHDAVAYAAHSRYLAQAMADVHTKLFLPVDLARWEHRVTELRAAHAAILDAIREQHADAAGESMRAHILETQAMYRRSLRNVKRDRRLQRVSNA